MKVQVRTGDSIGYYSNLFVIPMNLLMDSNNEINPMALQIGQSINIPGYISQPYRLRKGDTFLKLAVMRNLPVEAISVLNPNVDPHQLKVGETIILPQRVIFPVINGKKPYDYSLLAGDLEYLMEVYPFMKINIIGESVLGQSIKEIRIGKGKKKVHLNASFHANEWITSSILMTLLNTYLLLLTNYQPIRGISVFSIYQDVDLSIVPMVNPDGVNLVLNGPPSEIQDSVINMNHGSTDFTSWKANIRGVDLNNQFPAKWEIEKERKEAKQPAPRDYPGDAPLTEPEAAAMANLARKNHFDRMLAFHTQGEEFYWGYEGLEPFESQVLAQEFQRVSGYKAVQNIDSFAGYKDWFIKEFRKSGFTIELGKGINPLPLSQFHEIYEKILGIFLASLCI